MTPRTTTALRSVRRDVLPLLGLGVTTGVMSIEFTDRGGRQPEFCAPKQVLRWPTNPGRMLLPAGSSISLTTGRADASKPLRGPA